VGSPFFSGLVGLSFSWHVQNNYFWKYRERAMREEIKKRLEPTHLNEAIDAIRGKQEITESQEKEDKPDNSDDPRLQRKYTFKFKWADGRGKVWLGEFTNEILSIRQRQMAGVLRARMAAGVPFESMDDLSQEINLMIAHMTYSLVEKPAWAEDLQAIDDVLLLQKLYEEVLGHEAIFLGYRKPEAAS